MNSPLNHKWIPLLAVFLLGAAGQPQKDVAFRKIDGFRSESEKKSTHLLKDQSELKIFLATHAVKTYDGKGKVIPPPIDVSFGKEMLIAILSGTRPSGGYGIDINQIIETPKEIAVHYVETEPGDDCLVSMMMTSPSVMVALPKSDKTVRFVSETKKVHCKAGGHSI